MGRIHHMSGSVLALLLLTCGFAAAQTGKGVPDEELDPTYRPQDELVKVPYRYYLWYGSDKLWHLRGASKQGLARFSGTVSVKNGEIARCRPIGLETKRAGKNDDAWRLDADRKTLTFKMTTGNSFDGFDFSVSEKDATIEFDLQVADKRLPQRVFIGEKANHPRQIPFTLPAMPSRTPPPEGDDSGKTPKKK